MCFHHFSGSLGPKLIFLSPPFIHVSHYVLEKRYLLNVGNKEQRTSSLGIMYFTNIMDTTEQALADMIRALKGFLSYSASDIEFEFVDVFLVVVQIL